MNVRKPVDYSAMFEALDTLMAADLPQMELYCEIGRLVSGRRSKGAAVAAAEYLCAAYPDASGFSPRNLRRMREFYRTYKSAPEVLADAMTIGWTQNVVILEAGLSIQERACFIWAAGKFGWSKLELQQRIVDHAHLEIVLDFADEVCYTEENTASMECIANDKDPVCVPRQHLPQSNGRVRNERLGKESGAGVGIPHRICGGDFSGKLHLLMEFTDRPGDVVDPWYTGDFETTWQDVSVGCSRLLGWLISRNQIEEIVK